MKAERTVDSLCYFETGVSGHQVMLMANYFRLETHTDWCLYQYQVDFAPEEDKSFLRKALLRNHKDVLGGYIFDGSTMFTSHRLSQDVSKAYDYIS
jgi:aubergine-like protein